MEGLERLVEILADDERVHGAFGYESGARCFELFSSRTGGSQPNQVLRYPIEVLGSVCQKKGKTGEKEMYISKRRSPTED